MVFLSLGGLIIRGLTKSEDKGLRKLTGMTNGIGLVLALVGGFGWIARMKVGFPVWIIIKIVIWFIFGSFIAITNRKPEAGKALWFVVIALGIVAAYLGGVKPG